MTLCVIVMVGGGAVGEPFVINELVCNLDMNELTSTLFSKFKLFPGYGRG